MRLTSAQLALATRIGKQRNAENRRVNRRDNHGPRRDPERISIHGAAAELAVALFTGLPWAAPIVDGEHVGNLTHDVGDDIEVRANTDGWRGLGQHRNDDPAMRFVLVYTSRLPAVRLVGWLWGYEFRDDAHWREDVPYPAFIAAPHELRPIGSLKEEARHDGDGPTLSPSGDLLQSPVLFD